MKREKRAKLHQIYRRIPNVKCKGLCQSACSIIGFTKLEGQAMSEQPLMQSPFFDDKTGSCGYLMDGRCLVYDNRPAVCRLYGATQELPCPHDCEIEGEGRMLEEVESEKILYDIDQLSGDDLRLRFNATKEQIEKVLQSGKSQIVPTLR